MDKKETSDFLCHMLNVRLNDEENLRFQRFAEHLQTTRSRLLRILRLAGADHSLGHTGDLR